jgi:two-component system, chemotaxis family, protein-glutamate methylesterase/glutaminase
MNGHSQIRVLVVDDSATMRHLVTDTLGRDPGITVVAAVKNAIEARAAIKELNPDVMTLDVEMPGMSGLEFLAKVMRLRPMPVVMVSTLTERGSDTAVAALAAGAVDCVVKPSADNQNSFDELPSKVKVAAKIKARAVTVPLRHAAADASFKPSDRIVAVGASTGGVEALIAVLSQLPANCAPTLVTQHMPSGFTRSLASRLDRLCAPAVLEATHGIPLKQGHVYIAPGGACHLEVMGSGHFACSLKAGDLVNGHRPSVDVLFHSVASQAKARAVGVILTGMGRDGAEGLNAMRKAGARTIGQNQATSVVYGMPRVAHEMGAVEIQMPLDKIGAGIVSATRQEN